MNTRRSNALIWKYFKKCDLLNKLATCNYCNKCLSYKATTTNLRIHLKLKHVSMYNELVNSSPSVRSSVVHTHNHKDAIDSSSNSDVQSSAAEDSPKLEYTKEKTPDGVKKIYEEITQMQNKNLREYIAASNINFKKKQLKMLEAEHKLHVKIARLKMKKLRLEIALLSNQKNGTIEP